MEEKAYEVFIKTDENGYITAVNSSAFLEDSSGWTKINEGFGDKFHHAQGNYFPQPIITTVGAYRYKLLEDEIVECSAEEIEEQEAALRPILEASVWDELDAAYREGVDSI